MIVAILLAGMALAPLSATIATQDLTVLQTEDIVTMLMYGNSGITIIDGTFSYAGSASALGIFSGGEAVFGIDEGIVLSTGDVSSIIGPNLMGNTTSENGTPGDDDLAALVGQATNDAAVIEFDFIPENDFVSFQYVFGSEEYLEYVGSSFNDVFAFFVNGVNYALLPNGDVVSINKVNTLLNSEYYVDNDPRISPDAALDTEMDGFTTVLTFLAPVESGETNHLKIAVGDTFDSKYDSTVLIKAGSLTSRKSDLSLTKTVDNPAPGAQDTVAYTLTVSNAGPDDATGVVVEDILPEGMMYAGYIGAGTYAPTTGAWTVPTIAAGDSAALTLYAIVRQSGSMTNWAEIIESDNYDPDSTPGNGILSEDDMDDATINPTIADVSLALSVDESRPGVGDIVTCSITVCNDGPDDASGVSAAVTIPAGFSYVDSSAAGYDASTATWDIGALQSGESASMDIRLLVEGHIARTIVAEVDTMMQQDVDSTPGNGIASEDDYDAAQIAPLYSDLFILSAVDNTHPLVGDEVLITITVANDGPDPTSGVALSNVLSPGLSYVGHEGYGTYDPSADTWDVGGLATYGSATITIRATVVSDTSMTCTAEVLSSHNYDPDSTPGNGNTSEDDFSVVSLTPYTDSEENDDEVKNPYNHFAILMPVVITNMADANAVWGCLMDEMPDEVPEEIAALMARIGAHMENAISYTNTIYVNSELEKALACMREADMLLDCGCWERYDQ